MLDLKALVIANNRAALTECQKLEDDLRIQEAILGVPQADIVGWSFDHIQRRVNNLKAQNNIKVAAEVIEVPARPVYPNWL